MLSNAFYRNTQLLVLALCLILVWGLSAFFTLPRMEDPELVQRNAVITTFFPGATAERVEALVTDKIEEELFEVDEIKTLTSTSRSGVSSVEVELLDSVDAVDEVWSRVRDRVDDAIPSLPNGVSEPDVEIVEVKAHALMVALEWASDEPLNYAVLGRLAEDLEDRLRQVPGTEDVDIYGSPEEEITVEIDPATLTQLNLSASDVSLAIAESDAKVSAGQLRSGRSDVPFEVTEELDSLQRIRSIPVGSGNVGQFTLLGDIADIEKGVVEPPAAISLVNGNRGVVLSALVQSRARIDLWARQARQVLDDFEATLPPAIRQEVLLDQSQFVEARLDGVLKNLMLSALLVVGIAFVMMGWQSALVVGTALPLTVLVVFGGMQLLGTPIHQMSVTGIILALGLLIDNAIVMVDEVAHAKAEGLTPASAVAKSVSQMTVPLLASTLTTVLAFMPIALAPGGVGEFTGSIGSSVILAVIGSLALSLTVIASLAGRMHPFRSDRYLPSWMVQGISNRWLSKIYQRVLKLLVSRPLVGVVLALIVPMFGFSQAGTLAQQFFPPTDRNQFYIEFELPVQASLAETERQVAEVRDAVRRDLDVEDVTWFVGESAPSFYYNVVQQREGVANYAQGLVQLKSGVLPVPVVKRMQERLDREYPQALVLARQLEQGPPFTAPIELRLYGPDLDRLRMLGDQLRGVMANIPGITHTKATLAEAQPKLGLQLDETSARIAGLDRTTIARQLDTTLEGAVGGSVLESTEELPVRVRLVQSDRGNLGNLSSFDLLSNGESVPLDAVGRIELLPDIASIARRDGQRINTVEGYIPAGELPAESLAAFEDAWQASDIELPRGYRLEYGGEAEARGTAEGNLFSTVGILIVLMAATLVLSLRSFTLAGAIGAIAVAAIGLSLAALKVFDYPLGFMAILGTLGLVGLAINDSIVVLVALRSDPDARLGKPDAVRAVVTRSTRHVLTTTFTTIAGFAPLLLDRAGFWPPLAIAIAGGLGGATLLALFFIPSLYIIAIRAGWVSVNPNEIVSA
ncbi:MAG: efflux RND transporter permease subunit [Cyanobacteria bacterium P01_E01_bin.45]